MDERLIVFTRYPEPGVTKTTLLNQCIIPGYHLGVSPDWWARWYRVNRKQGSLHT